MIWLYLLAVWFFCIISILLVYYSELLALWREPVFRHPVLIVESDDWGAGPLSQVGALERLADILTRYKDTKGSHPVMTIAVILAIPDGPAIRSTGEYHRNRLSEPSFLPIREALQAGVARRVFALQLHGMEHYWPATLMTSQASNVRQWLMQDQPQVSELLPPHLQSRWLNATVLPSRPLLLQEIELAVEEETALYAEVIGQDAKIVVPPTFIWDDNVEAAWARRGVEIVVTPGRRNSCRDERGKPGCKGSTIRNGDNGRGVIYLVRNDYFEPEKGHTAIRALAAFRHRTRQGRPCLLETHRSNFLGGQADRSYEALDQLISQALNASPELRFISTLQLGGAIRDRSHSILEPHWFRRLAPWVARLEELPRFRKLGWLTGFMIILSATAFIADLYNKRQHLIAVKPD